MEITYTSCAICTSYFPTVRKNYQQEVRADGQKYADRTCGRDHVMESSLNLTMRHWKSMDDLRYCVSAKKTYRLFFVISAIIFFIMAICCVVLSVGKCKTFYNYIAVILAVAFFIFCGCMGICSAAKRAEVYKGSILYYNVFRKKEYRLSDIRGSRTKEESYKVYSGDGIPDPGFRLGHCNNFLRCIRKKCISFWTGI